MSIDTTPNNHVEMCGVIISNPTYNHEVLGEKFYIASISVIRTSGTEDIVPILISNRLIDVEELQIGMEVGVLGEFRSYNQQKGDGRSRLVLSVFVDALFLDDLGAINANQISLNGYLCKRPVHRVTPSGREIADLLLAVHRPYGKSDYIPCICWGRNAQYVERIPIGTQLELSGRIQSRDYIKRFDDGSEESRTAYEVSVQRIEVAEDED